jgi:6-phosphogluconolactonase
MSAPQVIVVPDADALAEALAARIARTIAEAPPGTTRSIALAGGSTPRAAYARLAQMPIDWSRAMLLFGDERCVPPDDPASNYRMVREMLLDHISIPTNNVRRIHGELPPERATAHARADLRAALGSDPFPHIDLVILGIGPDGHTASLFPGGPELQTTDQLAVCVHRPELPQPWRVSMSLPLLQAARQTVMVAADPAKAAIVARAIAGDPELPASRAHAPDGACVWMLSQPTARAVPAAQRTPLPSGSDQTPPPGRAR